MNTFTFDLDIAIYNTNDLIEFLQSEGCPYINDITITNLLPSEKGENYGPDYPEITISGSESIIEAFEEWFYGELCNL